MLRKYFTLLARFRNGWGGCDRRRSRSWRCAAETVPWPRLARRSARSSPCLTQWLTVTFLNESE